MPDDDLIDAEVVEEDSKRCPVCESFDVGRAKSFAAYLVLMVAAYGAALAVDQTAAAFFAIRSEERRVGKECRTRRSPYASETETAQRTHPCGRRNSKEHTTSASTRIC